VSLGWPAVPDATYYNLQLHHGANKVFEAWPALPMLAIMPTPQDGRRELTPTLHRWYLGDRNMLAAGVYRWYVWAGFGARTDVRYGELYKQGTLRIDARGATTG